MADVLFGKNEFNAALAMLSHEGANGIVKLLNQGKQEEAFKYTAGLIDTWTNRASGTNGNVIDQMSKPFQITDWDRNQSVIDKKALGLDTRIRDMAAAYVQGRLGGNDAIHPKANFYLNKDLVDAFHLENPQKYTQRYRDWYDGANDVVSYGDKGRGGKNSTETQFVSTTKDRKVADSYKLVSRGDLNLRPTDSAQSLYFNASGDPKFSVDPSDRINAPLGHIDVSQGLGDDGSPELANYTFGVDGPQRTARYFAPDSDAAPTQPTGTGIVGALNDFSDGITEGLEGAGRAAAGVAGQIGGAISGLFPEAPAGPAPGDYDFANAGTPGAIGQPNFGAGVVPGLSLDPYGNAHQGDPNALDPNGPGGFGAGLNVAGNTPNADFGAGITPAAPAPAPDPYGFGTNVSASIPNGSLGAGVTNLGMGAPPSQQAPILPPLQAATDVPSLYRNILGREGGADEVAYWNGQLAQGNSLGSLQAQFIASPEAQARGISSFAPTIQPSAASSIPAPTGLTLGPSASQTATDVPGLYQSILGRQGGADEIAYWNGQVANGESLGSIAAKFVASPEAQARGAGPVAPSIQAPTGLTLAPTAAQTANTIEGLYTSILGRQGGADEVAYWKGQQANGESLSSIAAKFQGSPEAQARGAQPTDFAQPSPAPGLSPLVMPQSAPTVSSGPSVQASDPIADLYRNVLGRQGGADEVGYWTNELRSGKSLDAIRNQFEASPEARSRQNPSISAPTLSPSYEAPTLAAPAASASYAAPGLSPLVGADTAPTIGAPVLSALIAPDFASPVPAPDAVASWSQGTISPTQFGQNVSQGVAPGSFGTGITPQAPIGNWGFSAGNFGSGLGATAQGLGGDYAVGSAVSNMGMDLPGATGVSDFGFGGDVSGYDANQGGGAPVAQEAPVASGYGDGGAIQGRNSQLSQNEYFATQARQQALATANANLFQQQITNVAPGNQTIYDYATGKATGGQAPAIQPFSQAPVNMSSVFAPLATAAFMPRFTF